MTHIIAQKLGWGLAALGPIPGGQRRVQMKAASTRRSESQTVAYIYEGAVLNDALQFASKILTYIILIHAHPSARSDRRSGRSDGQDPLEAITFLRGLTFPAPTHLSSLEPHKPTTAQQLQPTGGTRQALLLPLPPPPPPPPQSAPADRPSCRRRSIGPADPPRKEPDRATPHGRTVLLSLGEQFRSISQLAASLQGFPPFGSIIHCSWYLRIIYLKL